MGFEAAIIVLFDEALTVWRASKLELAVLEEASNFIKHDNGRRVMATNGLMEQGEDSTDPLRTAADQGAGTSRLDQVRAASRRGISKELATCGPP